MKDYEKKEKKRIWERKKKERKKFFSIDFFVFGLIRRGKLIFLLVFGLTGHDQIIDTAFVPIEWWYPWENVA